MKLKYSIFTLMTTFLLALTVQAQSVFNEVSYSPKQTTFKLNAPQKPILRIYDTGRGGNAIKKIKMKQTATNVWETTINGDLKGKFYTFDIGRGETPGVFAKAVGINGHRGAIVDMQTTNPTGWNNDHRLTLKNPADLI
ncbi:MAG: type I pullulanase, partial [Prevotella pallens]|nr:type I pullulanase [Prevotella pallens]